MYQQAQQAQQNGGAGGAGFDPNLGGQAGGGAESGPAGDNVVDADYEVVDEDKKDN